MELPKDYLTSMFQNETKESEQICPKHNEKMITVTRTNTTICRTCHQEEKEKSNQKRVYDFYIREQKKELDFYLNKFSELNKELKEATLENYKVNCEEEKEKLNFAKRIALEYKQGINNNTILKGNTGVGKSHLAHGILHYLSKETKKISIFVNLVDLMSKIDFDNREVLLEKIITAEYCVLDDLGSEMANRMSENVLYEILDKRTRTIITTNLTGQDLIDKYGNRVYSRMMKGVDEKHFMTFDDIKDKRRLLF